MADPASGYGGPDSASQSAGAAMGAADAAAAASGFNDDAGQGGAAPAGSSASAAGYAAGADRGFFGNLLDSVTNQMTPGNVLSTAGLLMGSPALAMMGGLASLGGYLGGKFGGTNTGPVGPGDGDGPERAQVQQIVPTFNPIEDMVGSEYVAYGGVGADQLRRQLFPYMNFNQPTQPGITGLVGQYAGAGQGTGLMTGPFGASNTQV